MAVSRRKLLACVLGLTAVRLSESFTMATSSSNEPPFNLQCSRHYLCRDRVRNLVSVHTVNVIYFLPNDRAKQCSESEKSSIGSQAEVFLNDCSRGGDSADIPTLKSDCLAQASGSVNIKYSCLPVISSTTPVNKATGDGARGVSTWTQEQGDKSTLQMTVVATAPAVVLSLTACSVVGMILVCWWRGLVCFASKRKATIPPTGGGRICTAEFQPAGRLPYGCGALVEQQLQHVLPAAEKQHPTDGASSASSQAVSCYTSLTEQEDHYYETLPEREDACLSINDQPLIYDYTAISSSPEFPKHVLLAWDSAGCDVAAGLCQTGD